jgi:trehalose 6-phosphate synthase
MNRLVVVSNRVPDPTAGAQAGGLAVALDGLMAKRGGLWFGWSGTVSAEARTSRSHARIVGKVEYVTVDLTERDHERYYNRFSNGVLWPLLHTMPELIAYDRRDAKAYREVNAHFAARLAPMIQPNDIIWIHDYHLMALPALLRAEGVTNPIGFFLHIPFAGSEVLSIAPEMGTLIKDMLSADLIGFQTQADQENFAAAAQSIAGAMYVPSLGLHLNGRRTRLGAFPVEIDPQEFAGIAAASWRSTAGEKLRRSLDGQCMILGVDRLDPTKGLIERLSGMRRLLESHEKWRRRVTLLQIAAVSRKEVATYRDLRVSLDQAAGALNGDWGDADWTPLRLVARAGAREVVAGYMRQARVGLVTPLRDGMNLVAKEYVAAQDPQDPGVLVLSRFAGAARQLDGAILVNPHDPDEIADALDAALEMSLPRRQARWQSMWRSIENTSALGWGRSFVAALLRTPAPVISFGKGLEGLPSEPVRLPHARGRVSEGIRTLPAPRQML